MNAKELYQLVDDLVSIDVEIKKLETRKEMLKQQVISLGEGAHPGHYGFINVGLQSRRTFKPEKAKQFLTDDQFDSCYETGSSIVVRITKFNREEVA